MREKTLKFIEKNQLALLSDKILVGCSGGPDSIALAHLLKTIGIKIGLAHVNYGFRGDESDVDASFVETIARQWEVPFHLLTPNDHQLTEDAPGNLQALARERRYEWFAQLYHRFGYDSIATAHHWDDLLETMVIRLCRGTGLQGIPGIKPKRYLNGQVPLIRPLLFASKEELIRYISEERLRYRVDASNRLPKYTRNRLRNEVMPLLKDIFPDLMASTQATFWHLERQSRLYAHCRQQWWETIGRKDFDRWVICRRQAEKLDADQWIEFLLLHHFTYRQIEAMPSLSEMHSGQTFPSPSHTLWVNRSDLVMVSNTAPSPTAIRLPEAGIYTTVWGQLYITGPRSPDLSAVHPSEDALAMHVEADRLIFPLVLRRRAPGDRFHPRGMNGQSKTVKKYLTDIKYPMDKKANVPVLCNGNGDIIWLPGLRKDFRYECPCPSETTHFVLKWQKASPNDSNSLYLS